MCTVKNARRVIVVLFLYVFVSRIHFIVLTKAQEVDGGWVCWSVYPTAWAKVRITSIAVYKINETFLIPEIFIRI